MQNGATALVVAHPGHEARVHGWMEREKPTVSVLTDGSGRLGHPRIEACRHYLASLAVPHGPVFGRYVELEVYRMLLEGETEPFVSIARELARTFVEADVRVVVGDASEGYNSTHDAGSLVCAAAVAMAERQLGTPIERFDFPLMHRPDHCPNALREQARWLRLDEEAFSRKLASAFRFYPELAREVQQATQAGQHSELGEHFPHERHAATDLRGLDVFRVECLRPVKNGSPPFEMDKPYYEIHGERQMAAGHYQEVIRYREHLAPLAEALNRAAERPL